MTMLRLLFVLVALTFSIVGASAQTGTMPGSRNGLGNTAKLNPYDQLLLGGANVQAVCALGSGQSQIGSCIAPTTGFVVDCGLGPMQYLENNGAFVINAPVSDGSCFVVLYNGASATATPTFTGFTVGAATGGSIVSTNTNLFTLNIWRFTIPGVGSKASYTILAHQ